MASRKDVETKVKAILAARGNSEGLRLVFDVLMVQFMGDEDSAGKQFQKLMDAALTNQGPFRVVEMPNRTVLCLKDDVPRETPQTPDGTASTLEAALQRDPLVQELMEILADILDDEPKGCLSTFDAEERVREDYFDAHPGTKTRVRRREVRGAFGKILAVADQPPRGFPFFLCDVDNETHVCAH